MDPITPLRRTVLFDLDGTLVDTGTIHHDALNMALLAADQPLMEAFDKEFNALPTLEKLNSLGITEASMRDAILRMKRAHAARLMTERIVPDERMLGVLDRLIPDYTLGVVTNETDDAAHRLLFRSGIAPYIALLITGSFEGKKKPAPDLYLKALASLNFPANPHCIAIEDSHVGVQAAKRAGLRCLRVESPQDVTYEMVVGGFA